MNNLTQKIIKKLSKKGEEYSFKGECPEECEMICDHSIGWCGDSYACSNCGLKFIPEKWRNQALEDCKKIIPEILEVVAEEVEKMPLSIIQRLDGVLRDPREKIEWAISKKDLLTLLREK